MITLKSKIRSFISLPWELHGLVLILLVASQFAPAGVDTVRDIYQAHTIASGAGFPWQGPKLANTVHLGPLWFYLLSIPAFFFKSWAAMAFLVFALSGLKIYLAYYFGTQVHSKKLGLLFAVFMALPGWSSSQLIFWTHTSILETSLLLYLICLRQAIIKPTSLSWLLSGLSFALALHAHPTALPFAFLLVLARQVFRTRWTLLLWWGTGAALLFVPYILHQIDTGIPDLAALQLYKVREFSPGGPLALIKLMYSVALVGPNLFYRTALPSGLAYIAIALHWLLISGLLAGTWFRFHDADKNLLKMLAGSLLMFLLVSTVVVLMRGRTPWHLTYAPSFVLAFCYGTLAAIVFKPDGNLSARVLISPIVVLLSAAVAAGSAYKIFSTTIRFQESVYYDVKNLHGAWGPSGLETPAFWSGAHGEFLCSQTPLVLHGPYATMIDSHAGMEPEMNCGRKHEVWVGGQAPASGYRHWVGISGPMKNALQQPPVRTIGNIHLYQPLAIADTGHAIKVAEGDKNPLRQVFPAGISDVQQFRIGSKSDSALLISTPIGEFLKLNIHQVVCNGHSAKLLSNSNYSWLYGCSEHNETGGDKWHVQYQSNADDLLDAVLLPGAKFPH